jgi:hypothetical protein
MECGGKRSATPLFLAATPGFSNGRGQPESAVVAALCRRSPKWNAIANYGVRWQAQRDTAFLLAATPGFSNSRGQPEKRRRRCALPAQSIFCANCRRRRCAALVRCLLTRRRLVGHCRRHPVFTAALTKLPAVKIEPDDIEALAAACDLLR